MQNYPVPPHNTRIGFHYYPDTVHYRDSDLAAWLPELRSLGASWLTLTASAQTAIPERFITGLVRAGIEPVLHFPLPLDRLPALADMRLLFETYAHWGIHYAAIFDQPNSRAAWGAAAWAQTNLVERFLDTFVSLADAALNAGLIPVFPPLMPGGDYWDTAFLRAALQGMQRRSQTRLLDRMVLGVNAWYGDHPLSWGAGGPERWPGARPYSTPAGTQDQRGFRIFDWYQTIFQAVTGRACKIILLKTGFRPAIPPTPSGANPLKAINLHLLAQNSLVIAEQMCMRGAAGSRASGVLPGDLPEPVPDDVLAANFWLLAAQKDHPSASLAWFQSDGSTLPAAGVLRQWNANRPPLPDPLTQNPAGEEAAAQAAPEQAPGQTAYVQPAAAPAVLAPAVFHPAPKSAGGLRPIAHYLLLPAYEWGVADWHLEVIRPFVKKHRPTVGFSLEEAALAERVTVVGGEASFPQGTLEQLTQAGCEVLQIRGDGTSIATQLDTL